MNKFFLSLSLFCSLCLLVFRVLNEHERWTRASERESEQIAFTAVVLFVLRINTEAN